VNEDAWAKMFFEAKPGILYKKDVYAEMKAAVQKRKDARAKQSRMRGCLPRGVDVRHEAAQVSSRAAI